MRVFVTGGSGFVGGALVRSLREDHDVVGMARSEASANTVSSLGAVPIRCSLEDVSARHLAGVEVVVHAAALVTEWSPIADYQRVNVAGTGRLLDASRAAGVRRFVHISSDSVVFTGRDLVDVDETLPIPARIPYGYGASKAAAERLVLEDNAPDSGFETVVVRPVLVWGPGDRTFLGELTEAVEAGKFAWLAGDEAMVSTTHVDNLAHGIELALERGRPGEVYFITDDEPQRLRGFVTEYAATAGVAVPDRSVPALLARGAARVVEGLWRVARPTSKPPLTRFGVDTVASTITVRIEKAQRDLAYRPLVTVAQGLEALAGSSGRVSGFTP